MSLNLSNAPDEVVQLVDWSKSLGMQLRVVAYGSPLLQVIEAVGSEETIEIRVERGVWTVGLAKAKSDEFFDSATWTACLLNEPVSLRVDPLPDQVAVSRDIVEHRRTKLCDIEALRRIRRERAYRRMGIAGDLTE